MIDQTLQIILTKLTEQAEFQKEQAEFQKELYEEQNKKFDKLSVQYEQIISRLDRIEANTIIIRDRVIGDFECVNPETKKTIEDESLKLLELVENHPEDIDDPRIGTVSDPRKLERSYRSTLAPAPKKSSIEGKTKSISKLYSRKLSHSEVSCAGNFVSKFFSSLLGWRWHGNFPTETHILVNSLLRYYFDERPLSTTAKAGRRT